MLIMQAVQGRQTWYFLASKDAPLDVADAVLVTDERGRVTFLNHVARELTGDERAEWWKRAVAAFPPYAEYQENTARTIPVFVLEPAGGA